MKGVQLSKLCGIWPICYIIVTVTMCNYLCCSGEDKIFITMVTHNPQSSNSMKANYYCFVNSSGLDVTVSAQRVISTREDGYVTDRNPEPPSPVQVTSALYPSGALVYWIDLDFSNQDYVFGTYACDASWEDGQTYYTTSVSNIIMQSNARIYPANGMVTKTVNVGDNDVAIQMTLSSRVARSYVKWRHNDNREMDPTGTSNPGKYTFYNPIQKRNAGLYICYESYRWNEALHGMQRLIVRGCQANRWGPHCNGICDNCYNGGICNDETGRCICPPGFMGTNCLEGCPLHRFGNNCEFMCYSSSLENTCENLQFCLGDPYGCSCGPGLRGLDCSEDCQPGKFGASCLQNCHCSRSCQSFTGQCYGRCEDGWSGLSCQIPNTCPSDYYGSECVEKCHCKDDARCNKITGECPNQECAPGAAVYSESVSCQECQGAYFGNHCQEECRCEESACDKVSGHCTGLCKPQWINSPNVGCGVGLASSEAVKVNPNTASQVKCTAESNGFYDLSFFNIILSRAKDEQDSRKIVSAGSTTSNEGSIQRKTWKFTVKDVAGEEQLFCLLLYQNYDTIYAYLPVTIYVYDLPELTYSPEEVSVNSSEVTISWIAWDPDRDVGDLPIVAYIPHYKKNSSNIWTIGSVVESQETLEFRVADLETDTTYEFAVAAVREGLGGMGPRGPSLLAKTLCVAEPSTPVEVSASLTTNNQIGVTWQVTEEIMCSTGISNFSVYYVTEDSSQEPKFVTMVSKDIMETVIDSSDLGNGSYTFYVTIITDVESILNIQGDKSSNATVSLKPKDNTSKNTNTTSNKISNSPPIVWFIVPVLGLLLLCIVVGILILFRMKKKQRKESIQGVYENTGCDKNEGLQTAPNSNLSGEYEGIGSKVGKSETVMVDIQKQTASLKRDTTLEEYEEMEDSEDENAEHIYGNLQAPDPIKMAMFEDYVTSNADNLEQEFEILKKGKLHPWTIAENESNKKKNRFKNMLTYDHSRVVLNKIPGDPSSDYYNASHIKNQKGENAFIASQGPNTSSLNDFWRMVWERNASTIVMITNLYEGGKDRCSQYWPEEEGSSKSFGNLEITWSKTSTFSDFVIRKLTLHHLQEKDEKIHQVQQFHFLTWPDMSVPKEVTPVLEFVKQVKLASKERRTPTVVHCSAGIGRTGTFIALFCLMDVLTKEKIISVFDFVEQMRENRINMVQTSKQYLFLYKCLLEFHQTRHTGMPAGLLESFELNSKRDLLLQEHKLLSEIGDVILKMKKNQGGLKEDNKPRNRFPDKVPYDGSRPFLVSWGSGDNKEGYINATLLKSFTKQDEFISTQSPLPNTIEDFWKLVFDWNCPLIVMLNQLDPDDQQTCMQYWPEEDSAEFGSMTITCVVEEDEKIFTRRVFEISHVHSEGIKSINHLQLHSWPPKTNLSAVLGLIQEVEKLQHHLSIMSPIVVHCIDGVGRSGVFVTVMSELQRIERNNRVDVFSTVRQLRKRHPDFVSNEEDYLLCYQLLKAHLTDNSEYQNI